MKPKKIFYHFKILFYLNLNDVPFLLCNSLIHFDKFYNISCVHHEALMLTETAEDRE